MRERRSGQDDDGDGWDEWVGDDELKKKKKKMKMMMIFDRDDDDNLVMGVVGMEW